MMKLNFTSTVRKLACLLLFTFTLFFGGRALADTLHVGSGQTYATLRSAVDVAVAGDSIIIHEGVYPGGTFIYGLQGTASNWIYILAAPGETVIYEGSNVGWLVVDAAYLYIQGIIFQGSAENGFNIHDDEDGTPAHHIVWDRCTFRDNIATNNFDLLKMSGVDDFEIKNCTFSNGSRQAGNSIDMVGCHNGLVKNNRFENTEPNFPGAGAVQTKGGSRYITIEANFFKNAGLRAINVGGDTDDHLFRPLNAPYEAADIKVYSNIFIGGSVAVAFAGCYNSEVVNNTIYLPTQYLMRILRDNYDKHPTADPTAYNTFRNNIVYRNNSVTEDINIGPGTAPETFTFSNNLWYHADNASWAGPALPAPEQNGIVGQNPLFVNASADNFELQSGSPAIGKGYAVTQPVKDYSGKDYVSPRSIGAHEGGSGTTPPPPPPPNCVVVSDTWSNTAFTNQTTTFTATFDATPSQGAMDVVVGLSSGSATWYTGLAAIVRFNASNQIDARNGGAYAAANVISYSPNVSYRFRLVVNVPAHTYSIYVTPAGGAEQVVGVDYAFRTEQNTVTQLNNWSGHSSAGGTVQVCNFSVATATSCKTVTNAWLNTAFTDQTSTFTAEFDATPSQSAMDVVLGLTNGSATWYTGLAAIVRFNDLNRIDARNGGTYAAANVIGYSFNISYHFRLAVNVTAHTYSIYVTPAGGVEQVVGIDYAFRAEQNAVTQLNNWSGYSAVGGTVEVCGFSINGIAQARLKTMPVLEKTDVIVEDELAVYPNPVNHKITLRSNFSRNGNLRVKIFNEMGKVVYMKQSATSVGGEEYEIDIASLPAGIYYMEMLSDKASSETGQKRFVKKLVKQ